MPANLLAVTAQWTAAARALESAREEPLFRDPFAEMLAGDEGRAWLAQRNPAMVLPMIIRTRFFDDFLREKSAAGRPRQVALLAAGLDTRALRLTWPTDTQVFELDQPEVLAQKARILGLAKPASCARIPVDADLASDWEAGLLAAGFDRRAPAIWLLEGFLFYLPENAVSDLLARVSELAAPGSWIGFDVMSRAIFENPATRPWVEMQAKSGAPWKSGMDDPAGTLAALGWKAHVTQPGEPDANYGRWPAPVPPLGNLSLPHQWLVTGEKTVQV